MICRTKRQVEGARAIPIVDPLNGAVLGITILDGGKNYDPEYLKVHITGNGSGFDANESAATIENGVVTEVLINSAGSGYTSGSGFSILSDPSTVGSGSGFSAEVLGSSVDRWCGGD